MFHSKSVILIECFRFFGTVVFSLQPSINWNSFSLTPSFNVVKTSFAEHSRILFHSSLLSISFHVNFQARKGSVSQFSPIDAMQRQARNNLSSNPWEDCLQTNREMGMENNASSNENPSFPPSLETAPTLIFSIVFKRKHCNIQQEIKAVLG